MSWNEEKLETRKMALSLAKEGMIIRTKMIGDALTVCTEYEAEQLYDQLTLCRSAIRALEDDVEWWTKQVKEEKEAKAE